MATEVLNPLVEFVKVAAVGPHGIRSGETWYKVSEPLKSSFVKGTSYAVKTTVGPKGGKIILSIDNVIGVNTPVLNPELNKATPTLVKDKEMTRADWDAKDVRISRSGVIQASIKAVSPHVAKIDQLVPEAIKVAEGMLEWVNKK